jgi:hypothetical protein
MKIAGIILVVLLLPLSVIISGTDANKSFDLAKDVAAAMDGLQGADRERAESVFPSAGRLKAGAAFSLLSCLAAVALLAVAFTKKQLVPIVAAVAVGASLLAIALYPHVDTGPLGPMAPRSQAMLAAALAAGGALGAWLKTRAATARASSGNVASTAG